MSDQSVNLRAGLHNVGSYQVSGIPFVTGVLAIPANTNTPLEIVFPSITQKIRIHNHDTSKDLRVGFSANGVKNSNYWIVDHEASNGKGLPYAEFRVKTDKIYLISNDASAVTGAIIFAELTGITGYTLAASYSGSAGIG
jgi:hypothetical protein